LSFDNASSREVPSASLYKSSEVKEATWQITRSHRVFQAVSAAPAVDGGSKVPDEIEID
jgi:hypothetical protein